MKFINTTNLAVDTNNLKKINSASSLELLWYLVLSWWIVLIKDVGTQNLYYLPTKRVMAILNVNNYKFLISILHK